VGGLRFSRPWPSEDAPGFMQVECTGPEHLCIQLRRVLLLYGILYGILFGAKRRRLDLLRFVAKCASHPLKIGI